MTVNTRGTCRCGAWWTGASRAHCGGCHRTFSTVGNFDKHRTADGEHGTCWPPEERGLTARGVVYGVLYAAPAVGLPEGGFGTRQSPLPGR
jgi:hypothetical protein